MPIDADIEQRLIAIEKKVDQSQKMLRSIKRKQVLEFWFGIIKVLVLIGVFYSAWMFIEPMYVQVRDAYVSFQGLNESVGAFERNPVFDFFRKPQVEE